MQAGWRILLRVAADGTPTKQFLDAAGKVTHQWLEPPRLERGNLGVLCFWASSLYAEFRVPDDSRLLDGDED
jgi:hypothetical protein